MREATPGPTGRARALAEVRDGHRRGKSWETDDLESQSRQPRRPRRSDPAIACPRPRPIELPMSHDTTVAHRQVEITNGLGLHVRPAMKFVEVASRFQSEVRVRHNNNEFNGKSLLELTMMAAERGTRLELEARGPDAMAAVEALAELVSARFYEDDDGEPIDAATGPEPAR
jgi:phosphocarrier protein HPr